MPFTPLDTKAYPEALCNDGSPGGFYLDVVDPAADWVLFLEGGGGCVDEASCADRWNTQHERTTSASAQNVTFAGILSADAALNPHFASFNRAVVRYCSSDYHSGLGGAEKGWLFRTGSTDGGASPVWINPPKDFLFRGRDILHAVLETLVSDHALGSRDGQALLLTGSSAGGFGVFSALYDADDLLARIAPGGNEVQVAGIVDAGYRLEPALPAGASTTMTLARRFSAGYALWNGQPDAACVRTHPDHGACYFGVAFAETAHAPTLPVFWSQQQRDFASLGDDSSGAFLYGFVIPSTPDWADWINSGIIAQEEAAFGGPTAIIKGGAFSSCAAMHGTIATDSGWGGQGYDHYPASQLCPQEVVDDGHRVFEDATVGCTPAVSGETIGDAAWDWYDATVNQHKAPPASRIATSCGVITGDLLAPYQVGVNGRCSLDDECASGTCSSGRCRTPAPDAVVGDVLDGE